MERFVSGTIKKDECSWLTSTLSIEAMKSNVHWILTNDKLTVKLTDSMRNLHKTWDPWVFKCIPLDFDQHLLDV